jgi:hypothetical protein
VHFTEVLGYTARGYTMVAHYYIVVSQCYTVVAHYCMEVVPG